MITEHAINLARLDSDKRAAIVVYNLALDHYHSNNLFADDLQMQWSMRRIVADLLTKSTESIREFEKYSRKIHNTPEQTNEHLHNDGV